MGWCWIQQTVESGKITHVKINGKCNPADFLTKPKSAKEMARSAEALNFDMPSRKGIREEDAMRIDEVAKWI